MPDYTKADGGDFPPIMARVRDVPALAAELFPNATKPRRGLWRTGDIDDTPGKSATIDPETGLFYDYAAGAGGDLVTVLQHRLGGASEADSFVAAVGWLEARDHLLPDGTPYRDQRRTSPAGSSGSDRWGRWECSPEAAADRLLRQRADDLLVVRYTDGTTKTLVASPSGRWRDDDGERKRALSDVAYTWLREALALAEKAEVARVASFCARLRDPGWQRRVYEMVGSALSYWDSEGLRPDGLSVCDEAELDAPGPLVGAHNGIVDLRGGTPTLHSGDEARVLQRMLGSYVSQTVAADYVAGLADSPDPYVVQLLDLLEERERAWLLHAVGCALWGDPHRRSYVLTGPAGGGKTTIAAALTAALGDYGGETSGAILSPRRHPDAPEPGREIMTRARLVYCDEPGVRIDSREFKAISGGGVKPYRLLHSNTMIRRPVSATLLFCCNEAQMPRLRVDDDAVVERLRVLKLRAIETPRKTFRQQLLGSQAALESLAAIVLREAAAHREPPEDVPSVAAARAEMVADMLGPEGEWVRTAMVPRVGQRLATDALYAAAVEAGGDPPWGCERKRIIDLAKNLHPEAPPLKRMRVEGKLRYAWDGWRLATEDEQAAAVEADDAGPLWVVDEESGVPVDTLALPPEGATLRAFEPSEMVEQLIRQGARSIAAQLEAGRTFEDMGFEAAVPDEDGTMRMSSPKADALCSKCDQAYAGPGAVRKLAEHLQHAHGMEFTTARELAAQQEERDEGEPADG